MTKKSDTGAGPVIRCRTGRGHPTATEFRWTFYPEQQEPDIRDGNTVDSNEMSLAGRPVRGLEGLLGEAAVQGGGGGDDGTSYTFTTTTPVLKSYLETVKAAFSASPNTVHPNLQYGRLECRAVNTMGPQLRPCVYRITGNHRTTGIVALSALAEAYLREGASEVAIASVLGVFFHHYLRSLNIYFEQGFSPLFLVYPYSPSP